MAGTDVGPVQLRCSGNILCSEVSHGTPSRTLALSSRISTAFPVAAGPYLAVHLDTSIS